MTVTPFGSFTVELAQMILPLLLVADGVSQDDVPYVLADSHVRSSSATLDRIQGLVPPIPINRANTEF